MWGWERLVLYLCGGGVYVHDWPMEILLGLLDTVYQGEPLALTWWRTSWVYLKRPRAPERERSMDRISLSTLFHIMTLRRFWEYWITVRISRRQPFLWGKIEYNIYCVQYPKQQNLTCWPSTVFLTKFLIKRICVCTIGFAMFLGWKTWSREWKMVHRMFQWWLAGHWSNPRIFLQ